MKRLLLWSAIAALSAHSVSAQSAYTLSPIPVLLQEHPLTEGRAQAASVESGLPYLETFDNPNKNTGLPAGWNITDTSSSAAFKMQVNALNGLTAHSGKYYLVSGPETGGLPRDARAYAPALALVAGKTYYVSLYCFAPGLKGAVDQFDITVGLSATPEAQTTIVIEQSGEKASLLPEWTLLEGTFTPTESGDYYFSIHHCTPAGISGNAVGFDDFSVAETPFKEMPWIEAYYMGGIWSFTADTVYLPESQKLTYGANTQNADTYQWDFGEGADPAFSSLPQESVAYNTYGFKQAIVSAGNENGIASDTLETTVRPFDTATEDFICNRRKTDKITLYAVGTYDYMVGINPSYQIIAEKFTLPKGIQGTVSRLVVYTFLYKMEEANYNQDLFLSFYAEGSDGLPGELIQKYKGTVKDLFGTTAFGLGNFCMINIPETEITGSFFVALELPKITTSTENMLGIVSTTTRTQTDCTTYAYYQNKWYPLNRLYSGANLSSMISPYYKVTAYSNVSRMDNDRLQIRSTVVSTELKIEGTKSGNTISLFDLSGRTIYTGHSSDGTTTLNVSNIPTGIYIVRANGVTIGKIVKQ